MRIVAPFGFYGWGNIGDEATLNGFAQLLSRTGLSPLVSIGSRDPDHTARVEPAFRYFSVSHHDPRRWWAKLRASVHAVVGGTPIMDVLGDWPLSELTPLVRSIDRWKVPLVFIGVGVEDLQLDSSRRLVVGEIAPRVRHWSVRCERDRERLVTYGVSPDVITVAADMAWLIEPATSEFGNERLRRWGVDPSHPLIGVNLVNENSCFDRAPELADSLAAALDQLADHMNARVIFLSNEIREGPTFDKAAATKVISRMRCSDRVVLAPVEYLAPRQMMSIIGCCDLTISMRYHFCLFSALQEVPFIAIERSAKVSDLCWDLEWPASVDHFQFQADEIVGHGRRLAQSATPLELQGMVCKMRERALHNVIAISSLNNCPIVPSTINQLRASQS